MNFSTAIKNSMTPSLFFKEIKSNTDSRTSIFEALIKEGETLKASENIKSDLPEEHENIVGMLVGIQEKWDVLLNDIKEKVGRYEFVFLLISQNAVQHQS